MWWQLQFGALAEAVIFATLSTPANDALAQEQDVAELLRRISSPVAIASAGSGDAAQARDARAAARSLVARGAGAERAIESALDSVESEPGASKFTGNFDWLLDAYALVHGPGALHRLRRSADNPRVNPLGLATFDFDNAIALALDLTFYCSAKRPGAASSRDNATPGADDGEPTPPPIGR